MESILFVCLGNICRSPTAKAVFDHGFNQAGLRVRTDSAGTAAYHAGSPPDPRAIETAQRWGLDIRGERARIVTIEDFTNFDRIYAMDRANLADLQRMTPADCRSEIDLVMRLAPDYGLEEVPDPYYGDDDGFSRVLDMLEAAADTLVAELTRRRAR